MDVDCRNRAMDLLRGIATDAIDNVIIEYIGSVFESWNIDGYGIEELTESIEPILRGAGLSVDAFGDYLAALDREFGVRGRRTGPLVELANVVPLETPVQMDLSPITAQMLDAPKLVRLDWLSNRRVMASQVDRGKLEKAELKLRQKAAERKKEGRGTRPEVFEPVDTDVPVDAILDEGDEGRGFERDVIVESVDIAICGRRILTGARLLLAHGRRYGLVGRNGIGKSTLLRHIAGRQLPLPAHLSILHVEQEVAGNDTPALQAVLAADFRREALLAEEKRLNELLALDTTGGEKAKAAVDRLHSVYRKLQETDADSAEARACAILNGLGFSTADQQRKTREFSGGWRMRLALAQGLFCEPDLLLLDEPTNMLDFPAVVWLESYLREWPRTVLVVSHDRHFLDGVVTDIIHMHSEALDAYRGDYNQFLVTRAERLKNQQREYDAQQLYRQHLQAFIDRWRYNANRAPQAQSRLKILEKLPDLKPITVEAPVVFRFPPVELLSPPIVQLDDASFSYDPHSPARLLEKIDLDLQLDSRMAIVGPNGAGKTTLLKLIVGQLEPVSGRVFIHGRLRIAYFSQHHIDQLDLSLSPIQLLAGRFPGKPEEEYRHHLGAFGLSGPLALQSIRTLSGGQKSRVVFATMSLIRPHLMILDEPTNHLDMDSIDALIRALGDFGGGVVAVSHDKRFISSLCSQIWVCKDSRLARYDGSIFEYAASLMPTSR